MSKYSQVELDEVILQYRRITSDQFYEKLNDPEFKEQFDAAYKRGIRNGNNFMLVDADGWRPNQYNVNVPPARPNEDDPFGPGRKQL